MFVDLGIRGDLVETLGERLTAQNHFREMTRQGLLGVGKSHMLGAAGRYAARNLREEDPETFPPALQDSNIRGGRHSVYVYT